VSAGVSLQLNADQYYSSQEVGSIMALPALFHFAWIWNGL
jgi:hypothetical protein